MKYGHRDIRNVLERSSARETTARVAVAGVAKRLLSEFGITILSHVTEIGGVHIGSTVLPWEEIRQRAEASEVRCADPAAERAMIEAIDRAKAAGETVAVLGGTGPVGQRVARLLAGDDLPHTAVVDHFSRFAQLIALTEAMLRSGQPPAVTAGAVVARRAEFPGLSRVGRGFLGIGTKTKNVGRLVVEGDVVKVEVARKGGVRKTVNVKLQALNDQPQLDGGPEVAADRHDRLRRRRRRQGLRARGLGGVPETVVGVAAARP